MYMLNTIQKYDYVQTFRSMKVIQWKDTVSGN